MSGKGLHQLRYELEVAEIDLEFYQAINSSGKVQQLQKRIAKLNGAIAAEESRLVNGHKRS